MPNLQIAASHYEPEYVGEPRKDCINCYAETNPVDPNRPAKHVRRWGSLDRDTGDAIATSIRGMAQTDGHASGAILIYDGTAVRTYTPSTGTFGTLTGSIAGSDRVQTAFSENEAGILANGSLYVSTGSAVAAVTDADWATLLSNHSQTAFTSITSIGQRLLATYGSRFAYSNALDFNNTTTLSFYTAESAPDGLVCAARLGSQVYLFGTQTIEPWFETGDNDAPFRPATNSVIQRGCLARDTVRLLDNSLYFVADDFTVRRIVGNTAQIVSDSWVTRALQNETPSDLICQTAEFENHALYIINGLNICCVYNVATQNWFLFKTYGSNTWETVFIEQVGGRIFGGSRSNRRFVELSRDYVSDYQADAETFGTEIVVEFSAHLPVLGGRPPIGTVRFDGLVGQGSAADEFTEGYVAMAISRDRGVTRGIYRLRELGAQGEYSTNVNWLQNGDARPPMTVLFFRSNDFTEVYGITAGEGI